MSKRDYIRWDAEGVEKIPPNEDEDIQAVADMINAIQKAQWNNHRHCYTGKPGRLPQSFLHNLITGRYTRSNTRPRQGEARRLG